MLNFLNVRIFYTTSFAGYLLARLWYPLSFWWLLALTTLMLGFIIYGAFSVQSGFFIKTVCEGITTEKKIALTFDDGPDPSVTPRLLELLALHNLKATFFCIGMNIERHPDLLRRIHGEGHLIANHTYTHDTFIDLFPASKIESELRSTEKIIAETIHKKVSLFRPPYGITNPNIRDAVAKMGYTTIGWNVRSLDTVIKDNNKIFKRIVNRLKPGAVVLLHDNNMKVLEIVQKVIDYASENGIAIVPLDELLQVKAYE